jgi:small redox-active disulfide protein 2
MVMKKLQILGTGCATCETIAARTKETAEALGLAYTLEKVTDIEDIMAFDIVATPALVVDGEVKVSGRLPSEDEIRTMLSE